jgi:AraC-like DNA-binding protein
MIIYGIWISRRFRQHVRKNDELKSWSRWLLAAYWGIVLTFIFYRVSSSFGLTALEWQFVDAVSLTVFIYLIAWLGYIEPRVFAGMTLREAINPVKYRHSTLNQEHSAALFRRISGLMEQEMLYRDSDLSLDLLAKKLNEQRHHVSQAINEQAGKSFSEFVNEYRVAEAQQLLAAMKKREMNAIEVAYQVGFGTKNAFNLAFKKRTGMTPTAYREANGKKV